MKQKRRIKMPNNDDQPQFTPEPVSTVGTFPNSPVKEAVVKEEFVRLITFKLDGESYAVDIDSLREIVKKGDITEVPNSPEYVMGILNLRGEIITILDLEKKFGLERETEEVQRHILTLENGKDIYGIIVDSVSKVISVNVNDIQEAPNFESKIKSDYIKGVIVLGKKNTDEEEESKQSVNPAEAVDPEGKSQLIIYIDLAKMLFNEDVPE